MSLKGKRRMVDNLIRMPQKASIVDLYSDQGRIVFSRIGNSLHDEYNYWKLSKNFQWNFCFKILIQVLGIIFDIQLKVSLIYSQAVSSNMWPYCFSLGLKETLIGWLWIAQKGFLQKYLYLKRNKNQYKVWWK